MEVKPGYKQTEVGVIPEDWDCDALLGKIEISHGYGFQSQYFTQVGNYRLTTPGNFYEAGGFRNTDEKQKYYDGPLPAEYLLKCGDLIVAMTEQAEGLLGSAAFVPKYGDYLHNQRLGKVTVRTPELHIGFLYWIFNSQRYRSKVRETAAGTKVKHTSPAKLLEIAIPFPSLSEQEAIAEALSDADALIESLEQLIAKKRDIKQGAMQELLTGRRRLSGFGDEATGQIKCELGLIPNDWKVCTLADICIKIQDGTHFSPKVGGTDFLYLTSKNIRYGFLDISNAARIDAKQHAAIFKRCDVAKGDLLLTKDGANTGNAALNTIDEPFSLLSSVAFLRFHPMKGVATYFLQQILSPVGQRQIQEAMTGNAITRLTLAKICRLRFPLPPTIAEQKAIAGVLSDMDAEITTLETKLDKARQLKQGMMQELLTGRTRLV